MKKRLLLIPALILLFAVLSGCNALDRLFLWDEPLMLPDNYMICNPAKGEYHLADEDGNIVVDSRVCFLSLDKEYIIAERAFYPPGVTQDQENVCLEFYYITLATDEVAGPMDLDTLESWYATLGRVEPMEWISANDFEGMKERREALYPEEVTLTPADIGAYLDGVYIPGPVGDLDTSAGLDDMILAELTVDLKAPVESE